MQDLVNLYIHTTLQGNFYFHRKLYKFSYLDELPVKKMGIKNSQDCIPDYM